MSCSSLGLDLSGFVPRVCAASVRGGHAQFADVTPYAQTNLLALPCTKSHRLRSGSRALREACGTLRGIAEPLHGFGLGRVPAWMVWQGLGADSLRPTLEYTDSFGSESRRAHRGRSARNPGHIPLADLIRELASAAAPDESESADADLTVVAMPDHFTERPQENLLAALPWDREKVRLLWRSVAAVLAWTENMSDQHMRELDGGRVAAVDIGNADISVTVLDLRKVERAGRQYLVPVRDLPEHRCFRMWPVRPFDLATAKSLFHIKEVWHGAEQVWQLCTGSDILLQDVGRVAPRACGRLLIATLDGWQNLQVTADELAQARLRALKDGPSEFAGPLLRHIEAAHTPGGHHVGAARHMVVLRDKLPSWIKELGGEPFPMLLFGSVTEVRIDEDKTLACEIVEELYRQNPRQDPPSCPGRELPISGVVSRGCAIYGVREQMKLPRYFERLPRFCVVGRDRLGKRVERDLIELKDKLVEGGEEYFNRLVNVARISRGQRKVRFRLKREEVEKKLEQEFPRAPLEDCKLTLDVSLRPAQGFATVRIIPDPPDFFGNRDVILDWSRMENSDGSEEGDGYPSFPPCEPIIGNQASRKTARGAIKDYVRAVQGGDWREAANHLKQISGNMMTGKAYGSDPNGIEIPSFIEALGLHHSKISGGRHNIEDTLKDVIKVAASLYKKTPTWTISVIEREFSLAARENLYSRKPNGVYTYAAGRCFSTPIHISLFTTCMVKRFRERISNYYAMPSTKSLGMNNWCKALQLILRLNEDAVLHIDQAVAQSLVEGVQLLLDIEVMRVGMRRKKTAGVSDPYKHAMLAIFYLLRFRAAEQSCLFLSDWDKPDAIAYKIRKSLLHTNEGKWRWVPQNMSVAKGQSVQSALLHFLESKATSVDWEVAKAGSEEVLDKQEKHRTGANPDA